MTLEERMNDLAQEIVSRELGGVQYMQQHLAVVSDAAQRIADLEKRCATLQERRVEREIGTEHMAGIDITAVMFWLKDAMRSDQPVTFEWNRRGHLEMSIGGIRRATFDRVGGYTIDADAKP